MKSPNLVPEDLNITLEKALEKDQDLTRLYEQDEDARRIIDIGTKVGRLYPQYRHPCRRHYYQRGAPHRTYSRSAMPKIPTCLSHNIR